MLVEGSVPVLSRIIVKIGENILELIGLKERVQG